MDLEKLVSLCKRRGFIFPSSEIYGGMANGYDFGPLGVELKNNIKQEWWKFFVRSRADIVGMDAAIIMNPKVWETSGHVSGFTDPLVDCKKCKNRFRADHLPDDKKCPNCGANDWTEPRNFNLLFPVNIGPLQNDQSRAYLRGEIAQAMFVDFKLIQQSMRLKLPFGIASQGRAFRNEITPGNFIFRGREFDLMEFEYFIKPGDWEKTFEFWLGEMKAWLKHLGISEKNLGFHEIPDGERAHYSKRTVDIEYQYPFGMKELYGLAYRTDFDLSQHQKASGEDLTYTDLVTNEKFVPHVIEPSFGLDRTILICLLEHYHEEQAPTSEEGETDTRVVLRFPAWMAPVKIAILPLSKKAELEKVSRPIETELRKHWNVMYDETQSIGRRYRRQDEIGTPYCVTVDFESLEDNAVTVRDRDSMKQERVKVSELVNYFKAKLNV
ncbi:MAG: glycine--tRNA ligase [Candidatus Magasanikbacteria bacterium]|nr:glycine--tRNA ligase [Candidatus Magasanikbacteria bacterium]